MNKKYSHKCRLATVVCVAILSIALLAACSSNTPTSESASWEEFKSSADIDKSSADDLRIGSLKGPTSIGLASMMTQGQGIFTVVASADELMPMLLQDELDIALLPANLASTLYQRTNGAIQVIDINTLGVLYVVTASEVHSVEELKGHTIYMTGKGSIPEYTLLALLEANSVESSEVDLQFRSEPAEVAAIISQDHDAIGILPQPYAVSATLKDPALKNVIDMTNAWEIATGGNKGSLITGVTVAKKSTIKEKPEAIKEFLARHAKSTLVAESEPSIVAREVVSLGIIDNETVAQEAIPLCNVVCLTGAEMKNALSGYLEVLYFQNPTSIGGALPDSDFYFG